MSANPRTTKTTKAKWTTRTASASTARAALRGRAGRAGTGRVGDPLAPGTGIQPAAGEPGDLHREQVVAGGDARPARVHDGSRRAFAKERLELLAEARWRLEGAAVEVLADEAVQRARNVPGDRIDRFRLAAVALPRARIEQRHSRRAMLCEDARRVDGQRALSRFE